MAAGRGWDTVVGGRVLWSVGIAGAAALLGGCAGSPPAQAGASSPPASTSTATAAASTAAASPAASESASAASASGSPVLPDNGHECKDWIAALARAGVDGYSPTTRGPAPNVAALVSHSPFGFTSRSCTADGPARADGSGPSSYVTLLVSTGSSAQPLWTHVTSDLPAMAPCASPAPTQTADGSKPHLGLQPCVPKREMAATGASDGVLHGPDQGGGQDPMDVLTNLYLLYGPAQTVLELNVDGEAPADLDALRDKAFAATWAYLTGS